MRLWFSFALAVSICSSLYSDSSWQDRQKRFNELFGKENKLTEILFQAFTWDAEVNGQKHVWYRHLSSKVNELAKSGVTHVWLPPVSRSVASQGYMPGDYYDLGEGEKLGHNRTLYGNKKELKALLKKFRIKGVQTLADIVINHRCGSHQDGPHWNVFHHKTGKMKWEKWAIAKNDNGGTGNPDTGGDFAAAPDIDHTNPRVQKDIVKWLLWMKSDIGFDGWRYDYTKGYDAFFVKRYNQATKPTFSVGEYWTSMGYAKGRDLLDNQDAHRQQIVNWIDRSEGYSRSFDFTTKGILQEACTKGEYWRLRDKDGNASGVIGWWPEKSVTFIDNHDTGSKQAHWPFPGEKVLQGYAYILTHPGTPTVFWDHFYTWGKKHQKVIKALMVLRHELGIHKNSELQILAAEQGLYAANIDGRLMIKMGWNSWSPQDSDYELRMSGNDWAIWVK